MTDNPARTVLEKPRDIIIPTAGIAMAWDAAGLKSSDALAKLEQDMLSKIPDDEVVVTGYEYTAHMAYRQGVNDARAALRSAIKDYFRQG